MGVSCLGLSIRLLRPNLPLTVSWFSYLITTMVAAATQRTKRAKAYALPPTCLTLTLRSWTTRFIDELQRWSNFLPTSLNQTSCNRTASVKGDWTFLRLYLLVTLWAAALYFGSLRAMPGSSASSRWTRGSGLSQRRSTATVSRAWKTATSLYFYLTIALSFCSKWPNKRTRKSASSDLWARWKEIKLRRFSSRVLTTYTRMTE